MTRFLWQDREADYVYPFSTRPECMALIQRPPEVALDIGCGSGGVGYALRQRYPACQLWGCELDASAAAQARRHFDHVIEQDAQAFDFSSLGLVRPFDLICLFDVLEHLTNPWKLLQGLHRIAAPDAHVLVSLPNVGNIALLQRAEACGLLPAGVGRQAANAYREMRRAQHRARLDEKPTQFDERLLEAERDAVLALWSAVFPTA